MLHNVTAWFDMLPVWCCIAPLLEVYDLNTHGGMEQRTLKSLKSMVKMKNTYIYLELDFNIDLGLKASNYIPE